MEIRKLVGHQREAGHCGGVRVAEDPRIGDGCVPAADDPGMQAVVVCGRRRIQGTQGPSQIPSPSHSPSAHRSPKPKAVSDHEIDLV